MTLHRKPTLSPGVAISMLVSLSVTCGVVVAGFFWIIARAVE